MYLLEPAPEFTLPDLDGRIHMLGDYRGRIAVVNFWSADCPHALRADRRLEQAAGNWGAEVAWLSIASNANEPRGLVERVARQRKLPVVLVDADQAVADRYAAQTTPHAFVVDPRGLLRYHGAVDDVSFHRREPERDYLVDAVEALRSGRTPNPPETPPFGFAIVRAA